MITYLMGQLPQMAEVFALALFSFCFGIVVTFLDSILYILRGTSVLKILHKENIFADLPVIFLWSIGSGLVGLLGGIFKIFNPQGLLVTSLVISISWPIIFNNFVSSQHQKAKLIGMDMGKPGS